MVLSSWRLPSLTRVPASPVPRCHRYYEGATTSCLCVPAPLFVSVAGPTRPPLFVFAVALSMNVEVTHQARDNLSTGVPYSGVSRRGRKQELSGFLATHPVPLPCSTTPAEPTRPHLLAVLPVPPSGPVDRRPQRVLNLEAFHTALASAAYASRAALPPPMQGSLPAGGLRLYREGVEPPGSLRRVSDYILPPFQALA